MMTQVSFNETLRKLWNKWQKGGSKEICLKVKKKGETGILHN